MTSVIKRSAAGALLGGSLLFTGGMGLAGAQPVQLQDGLVNVAVGNITVLRDVDIAAAVEAIVGVCPNVNVEDVNVLATQVDRDGGTQQVADCRAFGAPINITQNGPGQGNAPFAPGQNR
jgi:hypothetical protein